MGAAKPSYDRTVDSEEDVDIELPQPVLVRSDTMSKLSKVKSRVVVKPKRVRKSKKTVRFKTTKPRKRGPKPAWMLKSATVDDIVNVLMLVDDGNEVYINVSDQPEPFNKFTLPMVRHLAKKARKYPEICTEWNVLGLCTDGKVDEEPTFHKIPLNGRNSVRAGDAAQTRAHQALDAFKDLGFEDCTTNVLKDLGFGSKKATEYLQSWKEQ